MLSWVPSHSALAALRGRESALSDLPGAVVKVGVPRGPGAVEGERELLVVLVLLTPHPEGGEHCFCRETGHRASEPQDNRAGTCDTARGERRARRAPYRAARPRTRTLAKHRLSKRTRHPAAAAPRTTPPLPDARHLSDVGTGVSRDLYQVRYFR